MFGLILSPQVFSQIALDLRALNGPVSPEIICEVPKESVAHCVQSLCGALTPANNMKLRFETQVELPPLSPQVQARLRSAIERTIARNKERLTAFLQDIQEGRFQVGPHLFFQGYAENLAGAICGPVVDITIDHSRPLSDRISITTNFPEVASETFKRGCTDYANATRANMMEIDYLAQENNLHTPEELRSLITQEAATITSIAPNQLAQGSLSAVLSLTSPQELYNTLANLRTISNQLTSRPVKFRSPVCLTPDCQTAVAEGLLRRGTLAQNLRQLQTLNDDPTLSEKVLTGCLASFSGMTDTMESAERLRAALPRIKAQFVNRAPGMSNHSKNMFREILERVDFNMGNSRDPEIRLNEYENELASPQSGPAPYADLMSAVASGTPTITSLFSFCGPSLTLPRPQRTGGWAVSNPTPATPTVQRISDSVNFYQTNTDHGGRPGFFNLNISDFSCLYGEASEGIIAHEIGHVLSNSVAQGLLSETTQAHHNEMRTCAARMNPSQAPSNALYFSPNDDAFTEEDTADIYAMAYDPQNVATYCAVINPVQLTDTTPIQQMLIAGNSGHSPALRRLLLAAKKKGPLPDSCQSIVNAFPNAGIQLCQ